MNPSDQQASTEALREAQEALQRGDIARAETRCRDALAFNGRDPVAWTLLGTVLRRSDPLSAQAALARALECDPRHIDAYFHLGNLHREQGRNTQAINAYESVLVFAPSHPSVLNNLGLALQAIGQNERAEAAYRAALTADPGHRQALANLAHLLCRLRRYGDAADLCAEFVRRYPEGDATIWVDWGICQYAAHDLDAAQASFQLALRLAPGDTAALSNLGSVWTDCGEYERASEALSRAAQTDRSLYTLSMLAHCRAHLCQWKGLPELNASVAARLDEETDEPINAFAALSIPLTPAAQLRVARHWARDLKPLRPLPSIAPDSRPASSRLRVAYVSSDFRTHAIAWLATEVWERHDRNRVETYAYSIGPHESSPLRARIEAAFDHFADCHAQDAEQVARRIRADGIDVLVDLNGYTMHSKSEIFAFRPAPVQMSWLYLGTLGADWYDYVLTDRFVSPPEAQAFFSERFLYLPNCYCPSDTRREVGAQVPNRSQCGLPERGIVLCCFNNSFKILPSVFDVWMRLLANAPGSVLWLAPGNATAESNLRREAKARGVDPARLVLAPRLSLPEHLARHAHADLFLDTTPYNAGTTANDALFMGVPVVTCVGQTMASRVAGSQLHAIGLPELVTATLADYEALALSLAREPQRLAALKARLATNRHTQPLFDMARFTRALDDLLIGTWEHRAA
jgi:predicted O-linked N-acetylglucosamine transferase (SPINDLY family)